MAIQSQNQYNHSASARFVKLANIILRAGVFIARDLQMTQNPTGLLKKATVMFSPTDQQL